MKKLTFTFLALVMVLCCALCLVACGDNDGGDNDGGDTVAVASITLNKSELTLEIGGEEALTATVSPDNATNKTVSWSSDKTDIATVTNGTVKAVAAGTAVITATADGKSATCTVTVNAAADVKMSETAWNACVTEFAALTNYTETWYNSNRGLVSTTMKFDGTTYYEDRLEYKTDIYEKNGDAYFNYHKSYSSLTSTWTDWTKSSVTQENYEEALGYNTTRSDVVGVLRDEYANFTYADGKYTLAEYDLDGIEVTGIEVTVTGGKIVKITFTAEYLGFVTIENFGTTEIEIPTEYTDDTQSGETTLAGKTFVFYDMACDGYDADTLAQIKARNEGMTIVFGDNGNVMITQLIGSIVQTGTYTQEGENIIITVTSMTMDGDPIDVGDGVTVNCTYDGETLIMASQISQDVFAYSYFSEQAAE